MFSKRRSNQRFRRFNHKQSKNPFLFSTFTQPQLLLFIKNYTLFSKSRFPNFYVPSASAEHSSFLPRGANSLLCNVAFSVYSFSSSSNVFSKKTARGLRLPSGTLFKTGRVVLANFFSKKRTSLLTAKSSTFFWKKCRVSVRGVAKNAVDHAHGGKGRGGVLRGY